jgi:hypothetical protein
MLSVVFNRDSTRNKPSAAFISSMVALPFYIHDPSGFSYHRQLAFLIDYQIE